MSKIAELKIKDQVIELPILEGTENEIALDISDLRAATGAITLDIAYKNTGATTSKITFLDGEEGILKYRGYSIEALAAKSSILEVAYLLFYGDLPSEVQFADFKSAIDSEMHLDDKIKDIINAIPKTAHPMSVLASTVCSFSSIYESEYSNKGEQDKLMISLLAKFPILVAWIYKSSKNEPFIQPKKGLNYCENFLHMMYSTPDKDYEINPAVVDALDKLLILHADHEQNCSTSTVRIVGSSRANLFASITAGICALWGPLHGGANQEVIEMLQKIQEDGGDVDKWVQKAKDKEDSFRLMGFGHRVYKNFDPRASIIKGSCDAILNELGISDPILNIAKSLEKVALEDEYFISRKLYPNVDFYSGIIYKALDIPIELFTVMFALGRLSGWMSQWKELLENKEAIGRPRQLYLGAINRVYEPINKRTNATV